MALFDTLQYYEDLKRAGLDESAASAIAHGQLRFAEQQLVSKSHFDSAMQRLEADFDSRMQRLEAKIGELRTEVRPLYLYITLAILVFGTLAHFHIV